MKHVPLAASYCLVFVTSALATTPALAQPSASPLEPTSTLSHGFRLGGAVILNADKKDGEGKSIKERYDLRSAYLFTLGYEVTKEVKSGSWLNLVFVGNFSVSGLNQNILLPSINGLIGFEFQDSFQLGVGAHLTIERDDTDQTVPRARMIMAAGWTPRVGSFETPVHFTLVPDPDGAHRVGATVGVNW